MESAVRMRVGLDLNRYTHFRNSVFFVLPNYKAKIDRVRLSSKQLTIEVLSKEIPREVLTAKVYYEQFEGGMEQEEVSFDEKSKTLSLNFTPNFIYVVLLSKEDGELLDYRRTHLRWPAQPEGMTLEVTEEEIENLIRLGENETMEFKRELGKPEELQRPLSHSQTG